MYVCDLAATITNLLILDNSFKANVVCVFGVVVPTCLCISFHFGRRRTSERFY
ncbi:unnamed protein product, partial [Ceratitis capitata]